MTTASPPTPLLAWQLRADLFAQLVIMEKSGLPTLQAFGLLRMPSPYKKRIAAARTWLGRGADIAAAGNRSGLFTDLEAKLVAAACSAGSPVPTYRRLADYYARRAAQLRLIRARMALPALLLLIGLFVQPLPALLGNTIGLGSYLRHCLNPLALVAALVAGWVQLFRLHEGRPSTLQVILNRMGMAIPLLGKMLIRRSIRDFIESLALMLEAGMPILQALPAALDTIALAPVRAAFAPIAQQIERGSTLAQAISGIPYLGNGEALALIETGEASGKLPEMLFHYADAESAAIDNFNQQLAEWLPRIVYATVAAWVAYGILTGSGIAPDLPPELR